MNSNSFCDAYIRSQETKKPNKILPESPKKTLLKLVILKNINKLIDTHMSTMKLKFLRLLKFVSSAEVLTDLYHDFKHVIRPLKYSHLQ